MIFLNFCYRYIVGEDQSYSPSILIIQISYSPRLIFHSSYAILVDEMITLLATSQQNMNLVTDVCIALIVSKGLLIRLNFKELKLDREAVMDLFRAISTFQSQLELKSGLYKNGKTIKRRFNKLKHGSADDLISSVHEQLSLLRPMLINALSIL